MRFHHDLDSSERLTLYLPNMVLSISKISDGSKMEIYQSTTEALSVVVNGKHLIPLATSKLLIFSQKRGGLLKSKQRHT